MSEPIYDPATFEIQNGIGYLIGRCKKSLVETLGKALEPVGITAQQYLVLAGLASGIASTAGDVCKALDYDSGAMTRLVDDLERKDLVRRVRSVEDRRVVNLELTEVGQEAFPHMLKLALDALNHRLRGFSKAEVALLGEFLKRILDSD